MAHIWVSRPRWFERPYQHWPSMTDTIFQRILSKIFVWCNIMAPNKGQGQVILENKVHGANMGPIWGRQDPGGPHVGPMNFAMWDDIPPVSVGCNILSLLLILASCAKQWITTSRTRAKSLLESELSTTRVYVCPYHSVLTNWQNYGGVHVTYVLRIDYPFRLFSMLVWSYITYWWSSNIRTYTESISCHGVIIWGMRTGHG